MVMHTCCLSRSRFESILNVVSHIDFGSARHSDDESEESARDTLREAIRLSPEDLSTEDFLPLNRAPRASRCLSGADAKMAQKRFVLKCHLDLLPFLVYEADVTLSEFPIILKVDF